MPDPSSQASAAEGVYLDWRRRERCGFAEVVYGEGKSVDALRAILAEYAAKQEDALVTRIDPEAAQTLLAELPAARHNAVARVLRLPAEATLAKQGRVAVVTAGTTDRGVAEEAVETLDWMGVQTLLVQDVGVAGPHRLLERLPEFRHSDAVVVVAGMEGALPSVVGGHLACPVIAVPTSVGYGANFGGLSALLGMLNSCASNVAVVNIDAGFRGGYLAGLIALRAVTPERFAPAPSQENQA
ncbi:AIR carboxylase [Pirellulimonas nuda]|uniref:AIR carboxylase n=1 Tax=Pirellulimonas nuda TaxID=2528009 RepID=A0A518D7K1_9BACT|nr:nickel pincer cofactor biosynthesis protein LarB [Pirellulimonas nuda]QDU87457.1 AIR carboxylase [Pirellulimonas nuda]